MIGVTLFDGGNCFPYFWKSIYIILDIICSDMNNYQISFFANSWSDIINEVMCCCSKMTFSEFLRKTSYPFKYLIIKSPIIKTSFFTIELFAECRLIKLLSLLSLCTVVYRSFYKTLFAYRFFH